MSMLPKSAKILLSSLIVFIMTKVRLEHLIITIFDKT